MKLLSVGADAKTSKGTGLGYLTGALFMTPERHGRTNVCPWATKACRRTCIYETGHGAFPNVRAARERRREAFDEWKRGGCSTGGAFAVQLRKELDALRRAADRRGLRPAVRLNATSDVLWERVAPWLFRVFADVQFYDYTKAPVGVRDDLPPNYALAWSWSDEMSDDDADAILEHGGRLAVPFAPRSTGSAWPKFWRGWDVVDGDEHDLIFEQPWGAVIGLRFKGKGGSRPLWSDGMFAVPYGGES